MYYFIVKIISIFTASPLLYAFAYSFISFFIPRDLGIIAIPTIPINSIP